MTLIRELEFLYAYSYNYLLLLCYYYYNAIWGDIHADILENFNRIALLFAYIMTLKKNLVCLHGEG